MIIANKRGGRYSLITHDKYLKSIKPGTAPQELRLQVDVF